MDKIFKKCVLKITRLFKNSKSPHKQTKLYFIILQKSDKHSTSVAVTHTSGKPDLRLDMPPVQMRSPVTAPHTPSTASTNLSRRPTEDSTLDYAYDNPAMASTPSPNNKMAKPHESSL